MNITRRLENRHETHPPEVPLPISWLEDDGSVLVTKTEWGTFRTKLHKLHHEEGNGDEWARYETESALDPARRTGAACE